MLTDTPYWCENDQVWLSFNDALEHSQIGHQIVKAQEPTKQEERREAAKVDMLALLVWAGIVLFVAGFWGLVFKVVTL